jgi:hypothetical protein|tara:strand:+ start:335 stop:568 length:234 start_codon:yes stop_codon:yes gene_type:complete
MTQEVSMTEKNYGPEINALVGKVVGKFDINQRDCVYWGDVPVPKSKEAYEIWYDQMGYADSEETGPSYEEWLIHKAK